MKTDKISFGTKPYVGEVAARAGFSKYKSNLTSGIYKAFQELSKNGINDELVLSIGVKKGAKKLSTDVLNLGYYPDSIMNPQKSSKILSPKKLEKKSENDIKNIILKAYDKLKNSNKSFDAIAGYPEKNYVKIDAKLKALILKLTEEFGNDDWTCA